MNSSIEIVMRKIGELKPYENNPRHNDMAVDAVAASIQQFGFKNPVIIDKDGVIVAGHTRYKAAKKLGITDIPCISADDLSDEQIKAFRLADNKTAELAEWDEDLLGKEMQDVKRFYDANKDLDVDYMVFRPVESTAGSYYRDERKKRDAEEIKKIVSDMAMDDERVTLNFKWGLLDRQEERCTASWAQMALNEKGEVMYCCHKPYQIIGHIMDEDILAKKMAAVTDMSMCDIPCRMTAPNLEVKKMEQARKDACFI